MKKKNVIIMASVILAVVLVTSILIPLATCKGNNKKASLSDSGYTLSVFSINKGYGVKIEKNGEVYTTEGSAVSVRFDKNDFSVTDSITAPYKSVEKGENLVIGTGSVSSQYGSEISFKDYYSLQEDGVHVDRTFTVTKVGEDFGFMTELKWQTQEKERIVDNEWFIPANFYVNGTHTFLQSRARMEFWGETLTVPAEDTSVLTISKYKDGKSFTMTDVTAGYRETVIKERVTSSTSLYIDENYNIPGIVLGNEEDGKLSVSHVYPAYTNKSKDLYIWRLLPIEQGLTRTIGSIITLGEEKSYDEVMKNSWRKSYELFGYADKRYSVDDVYEVLIDRIDGSYSESNVWGQIPQYSTDTDHYFPDSGFLYRNIEFGTLMLQEGRARNNQIMIDNAWSVIKYQLENDKLEFISAYLPINSVYKRVMYDGLASAVQLYLQEVEASEQGLMGCADKDFLSWLLNYIVDKAEKFKDDDSAMALSFYVPLWKHGEKMFVDYQSVANRLLEQIYLECEDYNGFYGGIENSNHLISVAEDYMIILKAFVEAYEIDGRKKWLDKAVQLADYLETYQMIQPFNLNPVGATGAEGKNLAFIGNERFLANGYIFNNTNHTVLDAANTSSVIEYYKLYKYTGDAHYLDFAESKLYNALIYVNMGDKIGHMDDVVKSSGLGFMNEFVANSGASTTNTDLGIRGAGHDSVIAWNIWQIVQPLEWFKQNCGGVLPSEMSKTLTRDLAKTRRATGESKTPANSAQKAVDGNKNTSWIPSGNNCAIIDLNEFCALETVRVHATSGGASGFVCFSSDGENYSQELPLEFSEDNVGKANIPADQSIRYVKVRMQNSTPISQIEVLGEPVFYGALSYEASIVSDSTSKFGACIDQFNYNTAWNVGASNNAVEVVLDLGSEKEIFQTAIKPMDICKLAYKIEVSTNNEDWEVYTNQTIGSKKFIFVDSKYAKARYVKLTLNGTDLGDFNISDFKIQGR